jgi:glycosyltransferase involved in cell wall biosynthesis
MVARISVIVAVYNGADRIERCLKSVLDRPADALDVVVIDGGSSDGTADILRRYAPRLGYWHSKPDHGVYDAWNQALPFAKGDWLLFFGCDDFLLDGDALVRLGPTLDRAHPAHFVVYTPVAMHCAAGRYLRPRGAPWAEVAGDFMKSEMMLPHQGVLHHRDLFARHGEFDLSFRIAGDYELLLREIKERRPLFVPDCMFAAQSLGGMSTRDVNAPAILREMRRARHKNGLSGTTPAWINIYGRALVKAGLARVGLR